MKDTVASDLKLIFVHLYKTHPTLRTDILHMEVFRLIHLLKNNIEMVKVNVEAEIRRKDIRR